MSNFVCFALAVSLGSVQVLNLSVRYLSVHIKGFSSSIRYSKKFSEASPPIPFSNLPRPPVFPTTFRNPLTGSLPKNVPDSETGRILAPFCVLW